MVGGNEGGHDFVLHFSGPDSARQRTQRHPGTFVISLADAVELARRHAVRSFGPAAASEA